MSQTDELVAPAARVPALLPGERRLLASSSLVEALDGGLKAAAEASGDPGTIVRIALIEQLARREAAIARIRALRDETADPGVLELIATMEGIDSVWGDGVIELSAPSVAPDHEPAGLLRLVAILQQLSMLDAAASGRDWSDVTAVLDRIAAGAEGWLRSSTRATAFARGLPAAAQAVLASVNFTRSAWAAAFLGRLRRAAERHGLRAWLPWLDAADGVVRSVLGESERSRELLRRRLAMLGIGEASPTIVMAYAMHYSQAALTGVVAPFEAAAFEQRVTEGPWRRMGDIARHTSAALVAQGLATRGDLAAAAALLERFGPIAGQRLPHPRRIMAYEIAFQDALVAGRRTQAEQLLAELDGLFASPTRVAAVARMRVLLGEDADPVAAAADTGAGIDLVQAHWSRLVAAMRSGDRGAALRALAAFDPVAARLGASGLRVRAVRLVLPERGDQTALTPRQRDVAMLAAAGLTNQQIAAQLYLSVTTVETHLRAALRRLRLAHRSQLADALLPATPAGPDRVRLSDRQNQVAALIAAGCTNAEIAVCLEVAAKTVEQHIAAVCTALGVRNRTAVAAAFLRGRL